MIRPTLFLLGTSTLSLLFAVATPNIAQACNVIPCIKGMLVSEDQRVPANAPALLVRPYGDGKWKEGNIKENLKFALSMSATAGDIEAALEVSPSGVLLVKSKDLVAGETHQIEIESACSITEEVQKQSYRFEVGPTAPLPDQTLSLSLVAKQLLKEKIPLTEDGWCSKEQLSAYVDVEAVLPKELEPWRPLLLWSTTVDGSIHRPRKSVGQLRPHIGESWTGRGKDRVFTTCEDGRDQSGNYESSPGKHTVVMTAKLLGTSLSWTSEPLEVELQCDKISEPVPEPDPKEPEQKPTPDPSEMPTPTPKDPSSPQAPGSEQSTSRSDDSGCNSTNQGTPTAPWFAIVLLGLGLIQRARACAQRGRQVTTRP